MYIDTHCHLDSKECENVEEVIKNVGDNIIIASGYDDQSNKEVIELIEKYPNVYGTIGIHPSEVKNSNLNIIEKYVNHPKIVGIGEIGLDYHYGKEDKELQKEIFVKQIEIARKNNKPVVIHSRDAAEDTLNIIKENSDIKYVMHCYSYSLEIAECLLKYNVKFGIGGVLTFKNSKELKRVVENISLEHLLLETDSPWLSPEPYRGQKNEPKNVIIVANKITEIKNIPLKEVLNITTKNAIKQFNLNI